MGEVVQEIHIGNLMLVIREPGRGSQEYTVQIGDYAPIDEFIARDAFTWMELPIVGRLLNMAYFWIFQHRSNS